MSSLVDVVTAFLIRSMPCSVDRLPLMFEYMVGFVVKGIGPRYKG